jgi:hypothetical protein
MTHVANPYFCAANSPTKNEVVHNSLTSNRLCFVTRLTLVPSAIELLMKDRWIHGKLIHGGGQMTECHFETRKIYAPGSLLLTG